MCDADADARLDLGAEVVAALCTAPLSLPASWAQSSPQLACAAPPGEALEGAARWVLGEERVFAGGAPPEDESEDKDSSEDEGGDDAGLLSQPLSADTRLGDRLAACSSLTARQRHVLLFALREANTEAAPHGMSPLNLHAWNGPSLADA